MFPECFQNNYYKLVSRFQQNFLPHFHGITLIHATIFLKFSAKALFRFDTVPQPFFLNLTKITRHYFCKTYKIFEKFDRVSQTFSVSSLKCLLKLVSH